MNIGCSHYIHVLVFLTNLHPLPWDKVILASSSYPSPAEWDGAAVKIHTSGSTTSAKNKFKLL